MAKDSMANALTRWVILGAFFVGLVILGYQVLHVFFAPVVWAVILVYVTWPVYRQLPDWLHDRPTAAALVMTAFLTAVFALPILWVVALLREDLPLAYRAVADFLAQGPAALPSFVVAIPWLGPELQRLLGEVSGDRLPLAEQLVELGGPWFDEIATLLGDVGRNAIKFSFALLTAFFIYRDGERLLDQTRRVLLRFLGERARGYINAVGDTTRAVLYGLILTALAQGLLAGLGYWVAGAPAPALLGVLTGAVALIPFGPPLVWAPVGVGLLVTNHTLAGIGLLLWGGLVVSQIDNVIRPMVISGATRIPFLLVLFGVLGGLNAFGLVGIFLGPVVIAVLLGVWREWLEEQTPPPTATV